MRCAYPNELYHYGILGQKWGIRRFQNLDGSLTEEGKKRYYDPVDGQLTDFARGITRRVAREGLFDSVTKRADEIYYKKLSAKSPLTKLFGDGNTEKEAFDAAISEDLMNYKINELENSPEEIKKYARDFIQTHRDDLIAEIYSEYWA